MLYENAQWDKYTNKYYIYCIPYRKAVSQNAELCSLWLCEHNSESLSVSPERLGSSLVSPINEIFIIYLVTQKITICILISNHFQIFWLNYKHMIFVLATSPKITNLKRLWHSDSISSFRVPKVKNALLKMHSKFMIMLCVSPSLKLEPWACSFVTHTTFSVFVLLW